MEQQNIRDFNNERYTLAEGSGLIKELDDRTNHDDPEYNSIAQLGNKVKEIENQSEKLPTGGYAGTAQDLKNDINSINLENVAVYDTLAAAQALDPMPANGVIFQVSKVTDAENAGYYSFQSGSPNGTRFERAYIEKTNTVTKDSTSVVESGAVFPIAKDLDLLNQKRGKNYFDKVYITPGKEINSSGVLFNVAGRNVSDFIAVNENTEFIVTDINKISFYDASFTHLLHNGAPISFTTPADTAYVRVSVLDAKLDTAQLELGTVRTSYEPYKLLAMDGTVSTNALIDRAVNGEKIDAFSIEPEHLQDVTFLNMHDGTLRNGIQYNINDGVTDIVNAGLDSTYWIPCLPSTEYSVNEMSRVMFYKKDRAWISTNALLTFTTPSNCHWLRFNLSAVVSYRFQLNIGGTSNVPAPQPYKYFFKNQSFVFDRKETADRIGRRLNLADAFYNWLNGEKFPVTFLGDSTTNGNNTTNQVSRGPDTEPEYYEDYTNAPNGYCQVLQGLLRGITENNILRIYNAGFSGRNADWAFTNIETIMAPYQDTKMMGISHGINDRTDNYILYADNFYLRIENLIIWCFDNGIQPFLLTSQPVLQPYNVLQIGKDSEHVSTVGNRIKRDLADKWGLELVDVSKFSQMFMDKSEIPLKNEIFGLGEDIIHFGDAGHKFTAHLLFKHIVSRTKEITSPTKLDFSTQQIKSFVDYADLTMYESFVNDFKLGAEYTKDNSNDELLQEFYIFNNSEGLLSLSAHGVNQLEDAYVKLNGVTYPMTTLNTVIGDLEIGLHHIEAWSGETNQVKWLGFKLS